MCIDSLCKTIKAEVIREATIIVVTAVKIDTGLKHSNNVRVFGESDGLEEDARLSGIIKEDTFLTLNTIVEVVGAAELKEICRRGPDWCQEWKGGSKSGTVRTRMQKRSSYPLFDYIPTVSVMAETHGIVVTGSSMGRSSMKAELISVFHPMPRPGGHSALKPKGM
jgi:hypothetical protein